MRKIKIELPFNYFHFIFLAIILTILSFKYPFIAIFLILLLFYVRKHLVLFKSMIILCSLVLLSILIRNNIDNKTSDYTEFYGTITTIEENEKTNKLLVKSSRTKVIIYLDKIYEVKVGDHGYFKLNTFKTNNNSFHGSFDYDEYLKNNYIDGIYFSNEYKFIKKEFKISMIQRKIEEILNDNLKGNTLIYTKTLLLGIDSFDEFQKDGLTNLGVLHLFVISGLHLNFIILFVSVILNMFSITEFKKNIIKITIILFFLVITNFQLSILRASLMYIILIVYKNKVSNLDPISISGIIILILWPCYLYLLSFQLTFIATFALLLTTKMYQNKFFLKQILIQSIIGFSATIPLIINTNYKINFLSIFNVSILSLPFSFIILPITFISAIFNINYFENVFTLFNSFLNKLNTFDFLTFNIGYVNGFKIVIMYILIILILIAIYRKKHLNFMLFILTTFILIFIIFTRINKTTVSFISVGQGDSSFISLKNNEGNILIDAFRGTTKYLSSIGVNKIDYVIISHTDNDHFEELEMVRKNFKVENVLTSVYDLERDIIKPTGYLKKGDKIRIGSIELDVLSPKEKYENKNDNSVVFKTTINGMSFLFTGDISTVAEANLLDLNLKSDVLKVPHHGSPTSSSVEFVKKVNPQYAIFSYSYYNAFHLPNYEVMSRYKGKIYETARDGTIKFTYKKTWKIKISN